MTDTRDEIHERRKRKEAREAARENATIPIGKLAAEIAKRTKPIPKPEESEGV
jgi:hypothetical protein